VASPQSRERWTRPRRSSPGCAGSGPSFGPESRAPLGALTRIVSGRCKVLEHALKLRQAFEGSAERGKATLRALLGDHRMRVVAEGEGFRVEGLFEPPLLPGWDEQKSPPATTESHALAVP